MFPSNFFLMKEIYLWKQLVLCLDVYCFLSLHLLHLVSRKSKPIREEFQQLLASTQVSLLPAPTPILSNITMDQVPTPSPIRDTDFCMFSIFYLLVPVLWVLSSQELHSMDYLFSKLLDSVLSTALKLPTRLLTTLCSIQWTLFLILLNPSTAFDTSDHGLLHLHPLICETALPQFSSWLLYSIFNFQDLHLPPVT